jgi:serine/threonine-protein kinase
MRLCPSCEIAYPDDHEVCPRDGAMLPGSRPSREPLLGAVVAQRYRVLECIGAGRTATIYRVEHEILEAELVLKMANAATMARPDLVKRFLLQGRAASCARTAGAAIVDFGCLRDGTCYMVMEPCGGVSLAGLLATRPLPLPRAICVATALATVLDNAHSAGFIYGDLCADEVYLRDDPPAGDPLRPEVCLIDWGGVYALADSPRWPADPSELPRCCPPEATAGAMVTPQADQYQLASLTYQMLTGPVAGATLSARQIPVPVSAALARALSRRPEERFNSICEFAEALGRALPATLSGQLALANDPPLRYCPLCGSGSIDTDGYGSSGSGRCQRCGTIFSVLASPVRLPDA